MRRILAVLLVFAALLSPNEAGAAAPSRSAQCVSAAADLASSKSGGYTEEQIHVLTGCWKGTDGVWFWPASWFDPNLPAQVISDTDHAKTAQLATKIRIEEVSFEAVLRSWADQFNPAASAKPNLRESIEQLTTDAISLGVGANPDFVYFVRTSAVAVYNPIFLRLMNDPSNLELADFARWWMQRRAAAMPSFVDSINPLAKPGYIDAMGFYRAPWPWELRSEIYLSEYLAWRVAHGLS